jgi:signal transduction histidine kinase
VAVVRIQDNGVGFPPELVSQIFELFTQCDRTLNRSQGGLGIGLALARRLLEMHGGTIEAHSGGLGQGAAFIVRLPLQCEPT